MGKIKSAHWERHEHVCVQTVARACTAIGLIGVVMAVVVSIADVGRVGADACTALELAGSALELSCIDKKCV